MRESSPSSAATDPAIMLLQALAWVCADEARADRLLALTGLDVATVKGVVDRLCAKGLIAAGTDERDKRLTLLRLFPAGSGMIPVLQDVGARVTEETVEALNRTERRTLLRLLARIA